MPLIAVHGFGVDHRIMLPLDDMIDDEGWRRVYLDLPWAEGARDTGAATPRDVADGALEEVADLVGDGPFAIIGNSFGAMVARHVAHSLPDQCQGLATLAGAFQLDHARRRLPRHEVIVHDAGVLERAGDARAEFEEMAVVHTDQALRAFERFVLPGLRGADARVIDRLSAAYVEGYEPESDAEEPFLAPALHVFGRQDHVVGYEDGLARADHYPHGSFVVLDGAGHNLHLERPQLVGALIRDWLGRVDHHRPRA